MRRLGERLAKSTAPQQVAIALIAYLAFIALGEVRGGSYWHLLGVPAQPVIFGDLHVITSAWDCARRGLDPLVNNPCNASDTPMNYPRIWVQVGLALHLGSSATVPIGIAFAILFVISMVLIARWIPPSRAWIFILLAVSPTWMTVVERGNNDIVVLALVTFAACLRSSRPNVQRVAVAFCGTAAAIKIYPLVTLLPWFRTRVRFWSAAVTIVAVLYFALTVSDLKLIAAGTPEPLYFAYGARTLGLSLVASHVISSNAALIVTAGVIIALVCAGAALGLRLPPAQIAPSFAMRLAFSTGSALYLATFVANSNFAYRLIMLSLTIPYLTAELSSASRIVRRTASATLLTAWGLSWGLRVSRALPVTTLLAAVLFVLLLGQCVSDWRPTLMRSSGFHFGLGTFLRPEHGRPASGEPQESVEGGVDGPHAHRPG
jgi:hypothetical protein